MILHVKWGTLMVVRLLPLVTYQVGRSDMCKLTTKWGTLMCDPLYLKRCYFISVALIKVLARLILYKPRIPVYLKEKKGV